MAPNYINSNDQQKTFGQKVRDLFSSGITGVGNFFKEKIETNWPKVKEAARFSMPTQIKPISVKDVSVGQSTKMITPTPMPTNKTPDAFSKSVEGRYAQETTRPDGSKEITWVKGQAPQTTSIPMATPTPMPNNYFSGLSQVTPNQKITSIIQKNIADKPVSPALISAFLWQESGYNPEAKNDGGIKGIDRGIAQINSIQHPEVSDAQAYDPNFAINWLINNFLDNLNYFDGNINRAIAAHNVGRKGASSKGNTPSGLGPNGQTYIDNVGRNLTKEMRQKLGIITTYDQEK